ncbi:MAG TPA: amylo-alpha-1,6-glucosidase [Polyangia bacterium]
MTGDAIGLDRAGCRDLARSSALEWVDANGRGGYAAGTVSGLATRRYHGLLLVASHPPHDRVMLINHLAEWVETADGLVALSTCSAADPPEDGYRRCEGFSARPVPEWTYRVGGATLVRSILCPRGRGAVIVRWHILEVDGPALRLSVRPMLTVRPDHAVVSSDDPIATSVRLDAGGVSWQPRSDLPRVKALGADGYHHDPFWRRGIGYAIDHERGEPSQEDWWSPGTLSLTVAPGKPVFLTFAVADEGPADGRGAFEEELERRQASRRMVRPSGNRLFDQLILGAEAYIVESRKGPALLAGFPWFDVWTRDTFTAFGGLLLVTDRLHLAGQILKTFAPLVDGGLLPNNLPDGHTAPRWDSVDASLWFIVSVGRYAKSSPDRTVLEAVWPAVRTILAGYTRGTGHVAIAMDEDGLLRASDDSAPLTWMDAKCGDDVMTPRRGKPVEVQALWVQALGVAGALARRLGHGPQAVVFEASRARAIASFQRRFWYEAGGYLFDVLDGPEGDDATFRPNQLFALAFDAELVSGERGRRVLDLTRRKLLTPRGLRTLAEDDPNFHPRYVGPRPRRDAAYHQGTVWPFLLAPFARAWLRFHGRSEQARAEALSFFAGIEEHLVTEGCLGHLSEIFDATAPYTPRGCFAQAWSLGEILLALKELALVRGT